MALTGRPAPVQRIAIYGKGGIGKSTIAANLSAAWADSGLRVMQIGCDPKADSTLPLIHGRRLTTILDAVRSGGEVRLADIVSEGYGGALCVEAGGPTPGRGCAGRGITVAFEKLAELRAYEVFQPDVVLYDVLGDVVCGGFAVPMRRIHTDVVYVVTSGEMMALFAAGNIAQAVTTPGGGRHGRLGGLILNRRDVENERQQVERLAAELDTRIVFDLPRCPAVRQAEEAGRTLVEFAPESSQAGAYRQLARRLREIQ
jgi:nitrogenase iron protein NifH